MVLLGTDVHHKTVGIIGMGRIGEEIANRATGFHCEILYHNRTRKPEAEGRIGCTYVCKDEIFSRSDFLVLACPCTSETENIVCKETLRKMKV